MLKHSDRRATLRSAKSGPPRRDCLRKPPDVGALLVRTTSPPGARLLAGKFPETITMGQIYRTPLYPLAPVARLRHNPCGRQGPE
jgi:hypothetical protein